MPIPSNQKIVTSSSMTARRALNSLRTSSTTDVGILSLSASFETRPVAVSFPDRIYGNIGVRGNQN